MLLFNLSKTLYCSLGSHTFKGANNGLQKVPVWKYLYRKSRNFRCQNIFVVVEGYKNKFHKNFCTTKN